MEKVILIKGNVKREFSPRAAQIAIEHLGYTEFVPASKPAEVLTKTKPPKILKPVPLIEAKTEYPGDEHKDTDLEKTVDEIIKNDDLAEKTENIEEVSPATDDLGNVKKPRKSPVRSKSAKK